MRRLGWNPFAGFKVAERRAKQEVDQVARFDEDPRWRRGRIRDVVAAREVVIEINEAFARAMSERSVTLEELFPRPNHFRRAMNSMPSFDVAVTIKTAYHRDPMHRWTTNDIADIDALGSTLPYCDVVATDKAVAAAVTRTKLANRLGTVVLSRTSDIVNYL